MSGSLSHQSHLHHFPSLTSSTTVTTNATTHPAAAATTAALSGHNLLHRGLGGGSASASVGTSSGSHHVGVTATTPGHGATAATAIPVLLASSPTTTVMAVSSTPTRQNGSGGGGGGGSSNNAAEALSTTKSIRSNTTATTKTKTSKPASTQQTASVAGATNRSAVAATATNRNASSRHSTVLQQWASPPPMSFILTAAVHLCHEFSVGQTVYLMDRHYLQRWIQWAWHQHVTVAQDEAARAKQALQYAATQLYHVPIVDHTTDDNSNTNRPPTSSSTSSSASSPAQPRSYRHAVGLAPPAPGPIDASALSVEGHPLLLSPWVHVARNTPGGQRIRLDDGDDDRKRHNNPLDTSIASFSSLPAHPTAAGAGMGRRRMIPNQIPPPSTTAPALPVKHQPMRSNSVGNIMSARRGNSHNNLSPARLPYTATTMTSQSHQSTAMGSSWNHFAATMGNKDLGDDVEDDEDMVGLECVAVPEPFYECLRGVHGCLCDDDETISFQSLADPERLLLLHHPYHHYQQQRSQAPPPTTSASSTNGGKTHHHHHANGSSNLINHHNTNSNTNNHKNSSLTRPLEFRRKVIWERPTDPPKDPVTLMEKLMLEEAALHSPLCVPAVEVHPCKWMYQVITSSTSANASTSSTTAEQSDHDVASSSATTTTTKLIGGFVLVSREAVALDAMWAVMRVAEPNKASSCVRVWTQRLYPYQDHGQENASSVRPRQQEHYGSSDNPDRQQQPDMARCTTRPTLQGDDGYELVDWASLEEKKKVKPTSSSGSDPDKSRMTVAEFVQRHYPPDPKQQRQHSNNIQHNSKKELNIWVEIRSTVHSPWPRSSNELVERICVGDWVDAQDVAGRWYEAVVRKVDRDAVQVHYVGWASKWDATIRRRRPSAPIIPSHHVTIHSAGVAHGGGGISSIDNNNDDRQDNPGGDPTNSNDPQKHANSSNGSTIVLPAGVSARIQAPAPLWSRTTRWREALRVGDEVEVRDSSSIVQRPKWYRGIVKCIGRPNDPPRPLTGGADLEEYPIDEWISSSSSSSSSSSTSSRGGGTDGKENRGISKDHATQDNSTNDRTPRTAPLLIMNRTQQILVEVEQEKSDKAGILSIAAMSPEKNGEDSGLIPLPPYRRWVNLYGEELCRLGTHLKVDTKSGPATLTYDFDGNREPVEVLKSHPALGAGFMRESLRGTPPAPGSVGLHNLGNSCFLNSTVQCLNHIGPLTQFFLHDKYVAELNKRNPLGSGGNVATAFASLLKKMWSGEYSILAPRTLKQTVANFAPQFDNCYQHDSQEFCQFLMDGLHEDLNRVKSKPYVEELEGFGMEDQKAAIESWRKHLLRHDSIIVDHCQGMHRSHLTCPHCGRESIKFDVFSSISLPLAASKKRSSILLEDCIEKFMEGEQLDERNAWYCPNCRKHVCALKMIALWSVPDILILHLKRFTFDTCMTSGGMLRSKIDDKVEFPIEGLDLTKLVLGPIDPNAPPIYRLFGVSEHMGPTANSGHYTATVRNSIDGLWYRCNDSHVGRTSGEASITGGAYVLFYQRTKGLTQWAGMYNVMMERNINPYGGLNTDQEGFTKVKAKKSKKQ